MAALARRLAAGSRVPHPSCCFLSSFPGNWADMVPPGSSSWTSLPSPGVGQFSRVWLFPWRQGLGAYSWGCHWRLPVTDKPAWKAPRAPVLSGAACQPVRPAGLLAGSRGPPLGGHVAPRPAALLAGLLVGHHRGIRDRSERVAGPGMVQGPPNRGRRRGAAVGRRQVATARTAVLWTTARSPGESGGG